MPAHRPGDVGEEEEGKAWKLRETPREEDVWQERRMLLGLVALRVDLRGVVERGLIRWPDTGTRGCRMAHRVLYRV